MTTAPSTPSQERWLYGPLPDLLLGCAGLYGVAVLALLLPFVSTWVSEWATFLLPLLAILVNGPHYGATLLRVYEHREDRRRYAFFTVYVTLALALAFLAALRTPWLGSVILTAYVTWSPYHFAGQNYGLGLMFLRRRGIAVTPLAKRLFHASFLLSFGLAFLTIHGRTQGISVAPVPEYTNSIFQEISLGIPAAVTLPALGILGLAYALTLFGSALLLLRTGSPRDLAPTALLVATQALWFSIPAALRLSGTFTSAHIALSAAWIAIAHSVQYLWVTSYYARRSEPSLSLTRYMAKTLGSGAALLVIPALVFAPRALGTLPYDSGLSILLFSVLNLHHFILDGAIWKLRDGRVARVLLQNIASSPEPIDRRPNAARRFAAGAAWAVATACLLLAVFAEWEKEFGRRAANEGRLLRAIAATERLAAIGRENPQHHLGLAHALRQVRGKPELVRFHLERSLEIQPTAAGWTRLGKFQSRQGDAEGALASFERARALDPSAREPIVGAAGAWMELGDLDRAEAALEEAERSGPEDPAVQSARARLARMRGAGSRSR
jgi:tetratricopeptide (TPR) repeat protein